MKKQTLFSLFFCVALFFFIITFSISLPIYIRPFYYAHISPLNLTETGFSKAEITDAYNAVLDYLTLPGKEFSCGVFKYSQEGAAHFYDCKKLFTLNAAVLLISAVTLIILITLRKTGKMSEFKIKGKSASFYSGIFAIVIPLVVGIFAVINFETAFTVFHKVFFPGKTNWVFDMYTDEIIRILPAQFFMNCAALIGAAIFSFSFILIIKELLLNNKVR